MLGNENLSSLERDRMQIRICMRSHGNSKSRAHSRVEGYKRRPTSCRSSCCVSAQVHPYQIGKQVRQALQQSLVDGDLGIKQKPQRQRHRRQSLRHRRLRCESPAFCDKVSCCAVTGRSREACGRRRQEQGEKWQVGQTHGSELSSCKRSEEWDGLRPCVVGFKYSRALRSALLGCGEALVRQQRLHAGQQ